MSPTLNLGHKYVAHTLSEKELYVLADNYIPDLRGNMAKNIEGKKLPSIQYKLKSLILFKEFK
jgi:hypothetical protein